MSTNFIKTIYKNMKMMKNKLINSLVITIIIFILWPQKLMSKDITPYEWHTKTNIINGDFDKIKNIVTDYKNYNNFIPYIDKVKILSKNNRGSICYFEHLALGRKFWTQIKFDIVINNDNNFLIATKYLDGDAHPYQTEIHLNKINDDQTEIIVSMKIGSPGPSFIPDKVVNYYIDTFLDKAINNLKKRLKTIQL